MITTTYNYSSGSGFVYDAAKIGFVSNMAQLILVDEPGQTFVPTISASTYDTAILEYVGGVLRQKDRRPNGATFYAAWSSMLSGNWGDGDLTVTPVNGASIISGSLDLTGATNKAVNFSGVSNIGSPQQGSVELVYTPSYSGAPSAEQILFYASVSSSSGTLLTQAEHYPDGTLYLIIFDQNGTRVVFANSAWSPLAGSPYKILIQWDGTAGVNTITVDNTVVVSSAATYTRTGTLGYVSVGNRPGVGNANFKVSNMAFYPTVVTPATPLLPSTIYGAATANLPLFTYSGVGDVQSYTACTITDSGVPHYTLNGKYWNGSAWVVSNGTYVQANDAPTIHTNIASLTPADTLQINAIFQAQNSPQSGLSGLTTTYIGQIYPTTNPSITPNTSLSMDALSEFVAVLSASGSDGILFNLKIGAIRYWWSGSVWAVSNGTYAQSNTAADIQTNAGSLPIDTGAFVTPYALLHSADGTTTPMLTSLTLTYDYFGPEPSPPDVCKVFGYILDENEVPIVGATVSVTNETTFINGGIVIAQGVRTVKTNSFGYFSMNLVETATMPVPALLTFSVAYTSLAPGGVGPGFTPTTFTFGGAVIPDVPEANIASFTFQ